MNIRNVTSPILFFASALTLAGVQAAEVAKSAAEAKPIKSGVLAPNAHVVKMDGKHTTLESVLKGKKTVLIFYRGGWCPFCNAHLAELAKIEADVRAKGFQIVAVSPDTPSELTKTMDKKHLTYTLLSDSTAEAMKQFGVAFRLDDETFGMYRDRFGIDLEKSSGQKHHILPVPSVFVIDATGKITFAYSNPDYKIRLKGEEIMKALEKS